MSGEGFTESLAGEGFIDNLCMAWEGFADNLSIVSSFTDSLGMADEGFTYSKGIVSKRFTDCLGIAIKIL